MMKNHYYQNVSFDKSLKHAWSGLKLIFRDERNFRRDLVIAGCVIIAGILFKISHFEWIAISLVISSVLISEALNSVIEAICDTISCDFKLNIKDPPYTLLYRASFDKGINPFLFTPGERIAEGSSNVYTRLISDILPSWRNAPQRNKSVICTNDFSGAEYYIDYSTRRKGTIYVVIPPNDARLVIAPTKDIWSSFKDLGSLYVVDDSILVFLAFFYYIIFKILVFVF